MGPRLLGTSRSRGRRLARFTRLPRPQRLDALDAACRAVLERNWIASPGFTVPNRRKYPWQWLWDSCFHAVAWSALGDSRACTELESLFALQLPSGFVPHMGFQTAPERSLGLWHAAGRSDITQPPMYGHALRVLAARGFRAEHLHARAAHGLRYLLRERLDRESGLLRVVHPWETGCDDSPRWDGWDSRPFSERRWNRRKRELVRSIELRDGAAWANPQFEVGSAGFSALVAFNARELGELTGERDLLSAACALAGAIDAHWSERARTWSDVRVRGPATSPSAPTLDALLVVLVSDRERHLEAAFAEIFDARRFWRPFGPSGAAADQRSYRPGRYWRGDAWPQLIYLLMVAARRRGRAAAARSLAERLVHGCIRAGYTERWNPETGRGLGAIPQSWAALACEGARTLDPAEA